MSRMRLALMTMSFPAADPSAKSLSSSRDPKEPEYRRRRKRLLTERRKSLVLG